MPLEIGSVCQHADARRAMLLVGPGYGDWIEISPDQTGGGAGLLDLGNELDWPGPGQGCAKVADWRGLSRLGFQFLQRHPPPRRDDLPALRGNDLVEYGCLHQPVVSRLLLRGYKSVRTQYQDGKVRLATSPSGIVVRAFIIA